MTDRLVAADVEHFAVAGVGCPRPQERLRGIVHVDEIAQLRAVAENLDLAPFDSQADEPPDEALAVVLDQLARAIHVGEAQRRGADAEHIVVEQVVVLARRLVDPVDVGRPHQVALVHRQVIGAAVDLARAGIDHPHRRVVASAGFEHRQLRPAVDVEIGLRVPHAVDVADLAGEVEDRVAILHQRSHRGLIADVGDVDPDRRHEPVQVEAIAAVLRVQRVDDQDVRAGLDQEPRQVAADEAHAAGDHHPPAAVELAQLRRHRRSPGVAGAPARWRWCSRRTTRTNHSFITSAAVRARRRKLKNCDRPCARW